MTQLPMFRNPQPRTEGNPFIAPINNLIDLIAGAGIALSVLTVVAAAILMLVAWAFGGRYNQALIFLVAAIAAPIIIVNAGSVAGIISVPTIA